MDIDSDSPSQALAGKDVKELLSNVGGGGGAPAAGAPAAAAGGDAAAPAEEKKEEKAEEKEEVSLCVKWDKSGLAGLGEEALLRSERRANEARRCPRMAKSATRAEAFLCWRLERE
jgi:hypothetical protein